MSKLKVSFDKNWGTMQMKSLGENGSGKIGAIISQVSYSC
jgi:hypothetical protein